MVLVGHGALRYTVLHFPVTPVTPVGSAWVIVREMLADAVLAATVRVALLIHERLFMLAVPVGPVAPVAPATRVAPWMP